MSAEQIPGNYPAHGSEPSPLPLSEEVVAGVCTDAEAARPETDSHEVEVRFVFWEHVRGNVKTAVRLVEDSDVVALEFVGFKNSAKRAAFEAYATKYISTDTSPEEKRKAERYLRRNGDRSGVCKTLLDGLQGSNKQIVTVDVNRDDDEYGPVKDSMRQESRLRRSLERHASNARIGKRMRESSASVAASSGLREELVAEQVKALMEQYAGTGARIAVLLGAAHTPVHHALAASYPNISRVFIKDDHRSHLYPPKDRAARKKRFFPESEISEAEVSGLILEAAADYSDAPEDNKHHVENMSDEEAALIIEELEMVKVGLTARLTSSYVKRQKIDRILARHRERKG